MNTPESKGLLLAAVGVLLLLFSLNVEASFSRISRRTSFLPRSSLSSVLLVNRGGDRQEEGVLTLDEKVQKAMQKLGIEQPTTVAAAAGASTEPEEPECEDGVCPMPAPPTAEKEDQQHEEEDPQTTADRIAKDMEVDTNLAWAALGATSTIDNESKKRIYNEDMARNMVQQELDVINTIPEDSQEVQQLVKEGYENTFLVRRALAFSENNMDNARAILFAEEEEQQAEQQQQQQSAAAAAAAAVVTTTQPEQAEMKTVTVDANFDPSTIGMKSSSIAPATATANNNNSGGVPQPAKKEDVVFEATTAQIQELVIESPVPVLLDIHAEWCGPCKVLGPILEEMAIEGGGMFRLVKVNSDNERPVSTALEITALPTVFGIRDGRIVHMFQGMPKSEDFMKSFMMGLLMPGAKFDPPVTAEEDNKYQELSSKLAKTAGAASFSFSARERLQDRISSRLDDLVKSQNGDLVDTEESVQVLRSLLSNVIRNPYELKFRKVNLANKVLANKIAKHQPCIAVLRSVGFVQEDSNTLMIGKGKQVVNVAPLTVARDYLDKWIDKTRYDVAKAARKRKDEQALKELEESGALEEEEMEDEEEEEEVDPNRCDLKLRIAGKNKVHEISMHADDSLSKVISNVPHLVNQEEEMTITCVAKRLVVKSTEEAAMKKSLREYELLPKALLVVTVGATEKLHSSGKSSLAERAAAEKKKKKKGSHTMQSIGIYAKDDNAKGELIDGGGGSLWEHDVTDDEEDTAEAEGTADTAGETGQENEDAEEES